MQQMIFIADFIACSTCFGQYYAHHQELESYTDGRCLWYLVLWCGAESYLSGLQAAALLPDDGQSIARNMLNMQ